MEKFWFCASLARFCLCDWVTKYFLFWILLLSSTAPPSSSHISTHQTGDTQEMGSVDVELVPPIYYYSSTFKPPGASRAPGTEMPSPRSSWTRPSQDDPLDLQSSVYVRHDDTYTTDSGGLSLTASVLLIICSLLLVSSLVGCLCLKR